MTFNRTEIEQLLKDKKKELRDYGITEELFVVPVSDVRCFVPCDKGYCICYETIPGYCVVTEAGAKRSREDLTRKLAWFKEIMEK